MKYFISLSILFLCILDGFATVYVIELHDAIEVNPLMALLMKKWGMGAFLFLKVMLPTILAGLLIKYWKQFKSIRIGGYLLFSCYFLLIVHTVKEIMKVM